MLVRRWLKAGLILLCVSALLFLLIPTVAAQGPGPEEDDADGDEGGVITRIFKRISHVMTFPIETMVAALNISLQNILGGAINEAAGPFASSLESIVFGDIKDGPAPETWGPAWRLMRNISVALWPLTLGLIVVCAARGGVVDNPVTMSELHDGIAQWVGSIVFTLASAYLIGLGLKLTQGMTHEILSELWGRVDAKTLVGLFFNNTIWNAVLGSIPGAAIFFGLFVLIFGFALLTSLLFAYVARYTLLFILISIAPFIITIGAVRETRWIFWMWMKGMVITLLLGPINALLLKLAHVMATEWLRDVNMFTGVVKFLAAAGVLSVLISIDYAVVKTVFGAAIEAAQKAKKTMEGLAVAAVTLGGALLAGGLAGSLAGSLTASAGTDVKAVGDKGTTATATGGGGGDGEGGADGAAAAAGGNGGGDGGGGGGGGDGGDGATATRKALNDPGFTKKMGAVLRAAGSAGMGFRNPVMRALSGAARGVGGALGERGRQIERGQHQADLAAARKEARASSQHRGWQGLLDANGISPDQEGFMDMSRALRQLSDEYGGDAVRSAAPPVAQTMAAAQQRGGIPLETQAQEAGYDSPAEMLGGETEQLIWAHSGRPTGGALFPPGASTAFQSWGSGGAAASTASQSWGAGPSTYDYRVGADLSWMLGRRGGKSIDAYARLAHRLRDPALGGGQQAVDQLYAAAGKSAHLGSEAKGEGAWRRTAWPHFARSVGQMAGEYGLSPGDMPGVWLSEQRYLEGVEA